MNAGNSVNQVRHLDAAFNGRHTWTRPRGARALGILLVFSFYAPLVNAQTSVLTRSFDDARTGANVSESVLTPQSIATRGLRLLKSVRVDDDPRIEAQPLYVPGLKLADGSKHNVLFVATMANQIWAFDVDAPPGNDLLWRRSLGPAFLPAAGVMEGGQCVYGKVDEKEHRCADGDWWGINIRWGILSTPVIDEEARILYVTYWVVKAKKRVLAVRGIRIADGNDATAEISIEATARANDGQPVKDAKGNPVVLHPDQKVRAALLLTPLHGPHKMLFLATSGGENPGDPHGWVVAVDLETFRQSAAWVSTPKSFGGGIWQGSQGMSSDDDGNIYAMTGNGGYITDVGGEIRDFAGDTDFPESFVKLHYARVSPGVGRLTLSEWFSPFHDAQRHQVGHYNYQDQDLGSAAPVVPITANVVLGAGKDGLLYVLDRDHLKLKSPHLSYVTYNGVGLPTNGGPTGRDMDFPLADPSRFPNKTHHLHGSPVYWDSPDGPRIYTWGENESLRAWRFDPGSGEVTFLGKSGEIASAALAADPAGMGGMTGGMISLSANGKIPNTGIVWTTAPLDGDANHDVVPGIARAYDATELAKIPVDSNTPRLELLWDSARAGVTFSFSKFCPPFAADGKLFVPTYDGRVDVYALSP